jgi:hypothetical protein
MASSIHPSSLACNYASVRFSINPSSLACNYASVRQYVRTLSFKRNVYKTCVILMAADHLENCEAKSLLSIGKLRLKHSRNPSDVKIAAAFFLNLSTVFFCIIWISLPRDLNSHDTIRPANATSSKFWYVQWAGGIFNFITFYYVKAIKEKGHLDLSYHVTVYAIPRW